VSGTGATDNQISGGANSNLICYVAWKDELPVIPTNFNLPSGKLLALIVARIFLLFCLGYIDHSASRSGRMPLHAPPQGMILPQLDHYFAGRCLEACRL
jgi:hypothetical protein